MTISINKKITGYAVVTESEHKELTQQSADIHLLGEPLSRPDKLVGNTYKIKTPASEHALYITINDILMNEGTAQEHRRPFEIFINSKNMEHFQWIVALTRVMSAVFRKGGDITFLVEELQSVFDPKGGYFKKGGKYTPSLVAEIGEVLQEHLHEIGMLKRNEPEAHQRAFMEAKRKEYTEQQNTSGSHTASGFPEGSQLCTKCSTKAVIIMDNCLTCLNCGDSKCS
ncbi:MAG: NrdJb [Ferrovum sp. 37-45-19]|jgi:hypothetical protein|uniref:TSCPD domain-containing protein n=1 Tax=Ferrovum sp. JA12 TaxID=1356299 RepID=UPI000703B513|nr:NrdJb [Ferrovum sp. JA12]OYV78783.1 MAG: NrdJb [Ferrovum sp. 21-44-67]OYV93911.1 MAG: NrdJb [Ferrovum sp. 37-45-19]OZB32021.1 MAG: NrdJb [Ferrovum sp. 34-44-207]HQT81968.1 hypothetical protein [Ferrovaceae bacterium]KRH78950.1 ribonucleotide-diphosphate reductase subunit alpha [Ferrovum sp. JA12]